MIKLYLMIGLCVQIVIILERTLRGVADWEPLFACPKTAIIFIMAFIIGVTVNIAIWPAVIVYEIRNIIHHE